MQQHLPEQTPSSFLTPNTFPSARGLGFAPPPDQTRKKWKRTLTEARAEREKKHTPGRDVNHSSTEKKPEIKKNYFLATARFVSFFFLSSRSSALAWVPSLNRLFPSARATQIS
jgi:hypothetical protein